MRRGIVQIGSAAAGLAIVLTGCSSGDAGGQAAPVSSAMQGGTSSGAAAPSSESGSADAESVSWMNQLCGELGGLAELSDIEKPDFEKGDIEGAQKAVSKVIGKFEDSLASLVQGLKDLPSAPVPVGDEVTRDLVDTFQPMKEKANKIKSKLDSADADDQQAVFEAAKGMQSIGSSFQNMDNPLKQVKDTPLDAAGQQAPKCEKLSRMGSSSTSSSSSN